jgi:hypothetical protein
MNDSYIDCNLTNINDDLKHIKSTFNNMNTKLDNIIFMIDNDNKSFKNIKNNLAEKY